MVGQLPAIRTARLTFLQWAGLVETALDEVQGNIGAKNIIMMVQNDDKQAVIHGQRELLEVLLRNIICRQAWRTIFPSPGQAEPGSGLGLSTAKRIAELYGLKLSVNLNSGLFSLKLDFERQ